MLDVENHDYFYIKTLAFSKIMLNMLKENKNLVKDFWETYHHSQNLNHFGKLLNTNLL